MNIDPDFISFELVDPRRWRVSYAGVYLYDARSAQTHTQADLEQYRALSMHSVRQHIERMSNHEQMRLIAATRKRG
jgi:hypothetical protein